MSNHRKKLSTHIRLALASTLPVVFASLTLPQAFANETDSNFVPPPAATGQPAQKPKKTTAKKTADDDKVVEKIIVIGTRSNLMTAQTIKRDADTMVDAVSAADISVFQDRSVLEAIQRLPGISLERFASTDDPDHFGVEASNVIIRGMTQSRSEFNGRDTFTANSGRGLSYQDVPPELMGSIEIYKNQTADMIEGGIGGTVTMQTRKPFDSDGRMFAISLDYSEGDIAKEGSPTLSGLYSDRFMTEYGEFGVLFNYANSTLYGESHGIQSDAFMQYYARDLVTENNTGDVGTRAEDFVGEDNDGIVWLPNAANVLMKHDERKREGLAASLQYQNPAETLVATFEYLRSDSRLAWVERAVKYQGGFFTIDSRKTRPLAGTHMVFDEQGLFRAGTLTNGVESWRVGISGTNHVPSQNGLRGYQQFGHKTQMGSRVNDLSTLVEDTSFNLKWQPVERLTLIGDYQFVRSETANDDVTVNIDSWANLDYDLRGNMPKLSFLEPWNNARNQARVNGDTFFDEVNEGVPSWPGFTGDSAGDHNFFNDENSYFWHSAMDHYERSEGELEAVRLDGTLDFEQGFVKAVKAGVRYSKREQVVRSTSWNWGALAPEWEGSKSDWDLAEGETVGKGIGWLADLKSRQDGYETVDWSDFMHGGVLTIEGNQTIHATEDLIRSVMGKNPSRRLLTNYVSSGNWAPYPTRTGLDSQYGIFRPGEINVTTETTEAAYLRVDFGGDEELTYSGNIGLRYLSMERLAVGTAVFPKLLKADRDTMEPVPDSLSLPLNTAEVDAYLNQLVADGLYSAYDSAAYAVENNWVKNPYNYLSDDERDFSLAVLRDGATQDRLSEYQGVESPLAARVRYDVFLPSFNIKVDLAEGLVGRFAIAKAVAFPDMGDVRNRVEFDEILFDEDILIEERSVPVEGSPDAILIESARLNSKEGGLLWVGGGGNPYIKPMESIQYDFSLEWYFSDVGQLSAAMFHKNLDNYFTQGVITREFTHPITQSTQNTAITSTRNGGNAKLDGLEVTYQQFFEGWFEGFGVQATYTFIDANSVPNNEQEVEDEQWYNSIYEDTGIRVSYDKLPLEGQSDNTVNLVGMFENDQWSARLAYNWRSKYLLTTRDVISKAPLWYDDHGELDGSLFYRFDDHFTIGLHAKNITNARSETIMILNDDLLSTGRSWFVSDRRIAIVLKAEF